MKQGDYVHYSNNGLHENGRVKSIQDNNIFVVYACADEWDSYLNYTGVNTPSDSLHKGWVNNEGKIMEEHCDHHFVSTNAKWQSQLQKICCFCGKIIN